MNEFLTLHCWPNRSLNLLSKPVVGQTFQSRRNAALRLYMKVCHLGEWTSGPWVVTSGQCHCRACKRHWCPWKPSLGSVHWSPPRDCQRHPGCCLDAEARLGSCCWSWLGRRARCMLQIWPAGWFRVYFLDLTLRLPYWGLSHQNKGCHADNSCLTCLTNINVGENLSLFRVTDMTFVCTGKSALSGWRTHD